MSTPFENVKFDDSNPEPRCPYVLLLDTSGSMQGEPIRQLNAGLQAFEESLKADEPFFAPFFDTFVPPFDRDGLACQLARFLGSERVCHRTDDDKTLVVIARMPHQSESLA